MKPKLNIDYNAARLVAQSLRFVNSSAAQKYEAVKDANSAVTEVENGVFMEGIVTDDDTANFFAEEFEDHGFVCPANFRAALASQEGDFTLFINSPGGNVFQAAKMLTMLEERTAKNEVHLVVNGLSASAATYFLFANNLASRKITKMSQVMIHKAAAFADGNSDELTKAAERLDSVDRSYAKLMADVMNPDESEILKMMSAETWFTADEAIQTGLVNEVYTPTSQRAKPGSRQSKMKALSTATLALLEDL